MSDLRTVASFQKNNTQEVRVSVSDQKGYALVDVRVFAVPRHGDGEPVATKAGICLTKGKIPALIKALQAAEREGSR